MSVPPEELTPGAGNGAAAGGEGAAPGAAGGAGVETAPPPDQPWLAFEVTGARAVERAAAPTLAFALEVSDRSGRDVFMAALSVQIQMEFTKRSYDPETRERLTELFGEGGAATPRRMQLTSESVVLTAFTGSTSTEVQVLCNYDLELAAAKFFHGLDGGVVPLSFHFNGSVYYAGEGGRLQIVQVPWDTVADYAMPVEVWKRMMDAYYPYRTWVPVSPDTLEALRRLKLERGALSYDEAIAGLFEEEEH